MADLFFAVNHRLLMAAEPMAASAGMVVVRPWSQTERAGNVIIEPEENTERGFRGRYCRLTALALRVTPEEAAKAKRLMAAASLENLRLIHVRAGHMVPGCPLKAVEEKEMPTAKAELVAETNKFRVIFRHSMHGRRGLENATEVQIDATFEMIYSFPKELDPLPTPEELEAFAQTNSVMNCWPYWREPVQTTVAKMNLPPLVVPLLRYVPLPAPKKEGYGATGEPKKTE